MIRDLMKSAYHPDELSAMFKLKLAGFGQLEVKKPLDDLAGSLSDREFCYAALNKVSRSFAVVIRQLPEELRDPVCIFYLVLRGLDSIEDDSTFPEDEKIPLLRSFYTKSSESDWRIHGVGDSPDYRSLLAHYDKVTRSFQRLHPKYQSIINNVCRMMGTGMAYFSEREIKTSEDYDLYCHYVAGLVGIGLSDLFAQSGIESKEFSDYQELANSMGLSLQKTNIIRDYHEDLQLNRRFWPQDVWNNYAERFEDFQFAPASKASLSCLNELVGDALRHAPDCLSYLSRLRNRDVFRFCAIPQVMAIATLAKVYNNPDVFTGVVKIRKGLTAKLMLDINDFTTLRSYFSLFAREIFQKLNPDDAHHDSMLEHLFEIMRTNRTYIMPASYQSGELLKNVS